MKNIKSKVILTFFIITTILIVSFAITALGYKWIVDAVNSIDLKKERVDRIHEIKVLLLEEQKAAAASIINSDSPKKDEFDKISNSIKDKVEKLLAESDKINPEDKEKLQDILSLNQKYHQAFQTGILPAIDKSKKQKLEEALRNYGAQAGSLLQLEQKLKDEVSYAVSSQLKEVLATDVESRSLAGDINQNSAILSEKISEINTLLIDVNNIGNDIKALDGKIKAIKDNLSSLKNYAEREDQKSTALKASIDKMEPEKIQKSLSELTYLNRIIFWTQRKHTITALAAAFMSEADYKEAAENIQANVKSLQQVIGGQNKKLLDDILTASSEVDKLSEAVAAEVRALKENNLPQVYKSSSDLEVKHIESADSLEKSFRSYLSDDISKSRNIQRNIILVLASIIIISLLLGMLLAYMLYNMINPIKGIIQLLGRAENGDLTARASINRKDEIGELGVRVNRVLDGQQRIVGQVETATKDISTLKQRLFEMFNFSKDNVSKISSGLKNVVKSVKAGVDEVSCDLDDVMKNKSGAKLVSESTEKAVSDGMKAIEVAFTGEKSVVEAEAVIKKVTGTVQKMAGTISMLEDSSEKIGDITNTISEIASRTNLLALNAAIEASRAGQQGKGFAVLADEIRKLAEGSNKAAGAIKSQIAEIQDRIKLTVENMNEGVLGVEEGVEKINKVKNNIGEIIASVKSVVDSTKTTAETACKQTSTAEELARVVETITKAASEAAGTSENIDKNLEEHSKVIKEMEALSSKLEDASEKLNSVLGQFKV
ncbi:MAG: methyl-accepting chemotaxis protein [Clostridia bacterium]|nr:methyl-accepting chemotaxis protein [Clostridia bacterium]